MTSKLRHIFTVIILLISFSWLLLPLLILRDNYCFAIYDGMDSYAGLVQFIHDNHFYFHLNSNLPIANGIDGKYTFLSYNLYDLFNCLFGFVPGQILTRITGAFVGFFSFKHLVDHIYPDKSDFQKDTALLIAALYIVTPVSPYRVIGFASIPIVIDTFLYLQKNREKSKMCLLGFIFPILSCFDAIFMFVLGFWCLFLLIDWVLNKRLNKNLLFTFASMCISTVIINWNFFKVAVTAEETNRKIYVDRLTTFDFNWNLFKGYLLNGQYHATAYPQKILFPLCLIATIYIFHRLINKKITIKENTISILILCFGWGLCLLSALVMAGQESGFRIGILLIDGFQWGRVIALTRFTWMLMLVALAMLTGQERIWKIILYSAICMQLLYVALTPLNYNEPYDTIYNEICGLKNGYTPEISYKEFSSAHLFQEIKEDIKYNGEGVAAYGFYPSVLQLNNFNTIDSYFTVHSMEWQIQFREIIAPALEKYENYQNYYDTWGGRMYIFGPLSYEPTKEKNVEPTNIYIDVEAYKKYGGKYILSRAEIANANNQGLYFINDYDSEDSMYHIYLYSVKGE